MAKGRLISQAPSSRSPRATETLLSRMVTPLPGTVTGEGVDAFKRYCDVVLAKAEREELSPEQMKFGTAEAVAKILGFVETVTVDVISQPAKAPAVPSCAL